ncbi:SDR family NAD(P)-dependent oxidoreductase [Haliangium sp.]|uniref:SDR family NAD(P)-dependent oxidoreductase n=1 Tax=Haliangium sp. TaxID=2663208 RepID=UPI003D12CA18
MTQSERGGARDEGAMARDEGAMKRDEGAISIDTKVALVTGGGRGIGRDIAHGLASAGAAVAVLARSGDEVADVAAAIERDGGRALAVTADVTDRDAVERATERIEHTLGPIDLLVNNAGVRGTRGDFWQNSPDDWWRVVEINLRGPAVCARAVLPGMVERGRGRIINVASDVATRTTTRNLDYACSKAGLLRLTDCLAASVKKHGVSVFAISPGMVRTSMTEAYWGPDAGARRLPDTVWTAPEQVVSFVLALASGRADALSGRYLHVRQGSLEEQLAAAEDIVRNDLLVLRLRPAP